jgi:hyperosmotically inducible protein
MHVVLSVLIAIGLMGCASPNLLLRGSGVYDLYAVGVEERSLWTMLSDKRIKLSIQSSLAQLDSSNLFDVGVESFFGTVYLIGQFQTHAMRDQITAIAQETRGVRHVVAHLVPYDATTTCTTRTNIAILADVKSRLFQDPHIRGSNIHVHTLQCHVVLTGVVTTKMERDRAEWIAQRTPQSTGATSYLRALH